MYVLYNKSLNALPEGQYCNRSCSSFSFQPILTFDRHFCRCRPTGNGLDHSSPWIEGQGHRIKSVLQCGVAMCSAVGSFGGNTDGLTSILDRGQHSNCT